MILFTVSGFFCGSESGIIFKNVSGNARSQRGISSSRCSAEYKNDSMHSLGKYVITANEVLINSVRRGTTHRQKTAHVTEYTVPHDRTPLHVQGGSKTV